MKVAVVGGGFGARVVAPVFEQTDGCDVAGVVSARDDDAVRALVTRPDVDLVSVHSPPFLHASHVRLALEARKAVLCDKPFALDGAEAAELEREARAAGVLGLCNFEFRYAPERERLRDLVADGVFGNLEHVQISHWSSGTRVPLRPWGWLFDRALGGGWIGAWGSHAIDMLRWTFGVEVVDVEGRLRIDVRERPDRDGTMHTCTAEDGFTASLTLSDGATVTIDSGFGAAATLPSRITVFGSAAVGELVGESRFMIRRPNEPRETIDLPHDAAADAHLAPMRRFAEVVRDAVHAGEAPPHVPSFADGRACDSVLAQLRAQPFVPAVPDVG